ncbi:YciI family protein [Plantactinospora siamensis]|uniref:YciI family protein n=1 Tax=Plantactinospora siamensis TaxID=555372 RepID=A0ABV6NW46_9ACTN
MDLVREDDMPQYAVLIYPAADDAQAGPEVLQAHDRHAAELERSGGLVAAFALEPDATATSIRADAVTDGPFVDAKEVVAGFYVIEAPDLDAALRIAGANPAVAQGGGVEVRPVEGSFVRPTAGG